jgi:RimJ/RimL family protein N-acetyltransferase
MTAKYRPRRITLHDGREVTVRAIVEADAAEIVQAFERLSAESRYYRFMKHKRQLDDAALQRGVHPRPGRDFVFVATIPATDGIDIVGAAQYVQAGDPGDKTCEFAVTVAEDWRRTGLATELLASLVRRARRDGYETMEGLVVAENTAMLALSRRLKFRAEPVPGDATVLRVQRSLQGLLRSTTARERTRGARTGT